jgi:outer membrane protein
MKKYIIIFLLIIVPFSSNSKEGVFFLDVDYLLNNSNEGKKIIQKLKNINDKNIIEIENYEKELKTEDEEINKVKNIISEDELSTRVNNLKQKISIYREKKNKIFKEYNDIKNKELEIFFNKITPYIEEFMENNSINLILDKKNIFIANSNYDITNSLIEFLNLK